MGKQKLLSFHLCFLRVQIVSVFCVRATACVQVFVKYVLSHIPTPYNN